MNLPAKKALVQLGESLVITALITALIAVGPILSSTGPVDYKQALLAFVVAFIFSLAHGATAYLKSYNAPLAAVVDADVSALEKKVVIPVDKLTPVSPAQPLQGNKGGI